MRRAHDSHQRRHLLRCAAEALDEEPAFLGCLAAHTAGDALDVIDSSIYGLGRTRGFRRGYSRALTDNDPERALMRAGLGLSPRQSRGRGRAPRKAKR